jgi:hypothetical protein
MEIASMRCQERFHCAGAVLQRVAQVPAPPIAGLNNFTQGNGLSRSFGADGPTEKAVVMKDTDFGHVAWIIANDDGLTHISREGEIEVS